MPCERQCSRSPVSALAVSAMIGVLGTPVRVSCSRISRVAAKPSITGISQSISTASKRRCAIEIDCLRFHPRRGLISTPMLSSDAAEMKALTALSSTSRTVLPRAASSALDWYRSARWLRIDAVRSAHLGKQQPNCEHAAAARCAPDADRSAHRVGELTRDRQPQAGPAVAPRHPRLDLEEGSKSSGILSAGMPIPVSAMRMTSLTPSSRSHRRAAAVSRRLRRRELDRVADKVHDDATEFFLVALNHGQIARVPRRIEAKRDALWPSHSPGMSAPRSGRRGERRAERCSVRSPLASSLAKSRISLRSGAGRRPPAVQRG